MRMFGGLVTSLTGIATLVAGLLIILKKGPFGGALILLVMALLLFVVSFLSYIANWKKHKKNG